MQLCGSTLAPQFNLLYPNHKIMCKKRCVVYHVTQKEEELWSCIPKPNTLGHATGCYDQVQKVKLLPLASIPFSFSGYLNLLNYFLAHRMLFLQLVPSSALTFKSGWSCQGQFSCKGGWESQCPAILVSIAANDAQNQQLQSCRRVQSFYLFSPKVVSP